jgi:hypothetical protein
LQRGGRRKFKKGKVKREPTPTPCRPIAPPSPRFILTSFHPYSLSISRAGIDCARNASFTSCPPTEMPRSSKYRIMIRLPSWTACQKPGLRSLTGGSRASINSASGAVSVESHARQSAESLSGFQAFTLRRSHDTVTGCILLSHVESRDIVERGLSDVNDAGTTKDLCRHIQYLQYQEQRPPLLNCFCFCILKKYPLSPS